VTDIPDRSKPSSTAIFTELFRLFWIRHKWKILILFIFLLITGKGLFYISTAAAVATSLILLLSGTWAGLSRHGESYDQLIYQSQMPISESTHHLLRQIAGAGWLGAVFLLAVTIPQIFKYLKLDPEFRGYVFGLRESPVWMIPIWPLAVLTLYFTVSAIVIAVRKPVVWISLIAVAGFSIWSIAPVIGLPQIRIPFDVLLLGEFGFFRAIAPNLWLPDMWLPHIERIGFDSWISALPTLLWFGIACIGLLVACRLRRED